MDDAYVNVATEEIEVKAEPYNSITISVTTNGDIGAALLSVVDVLKSLK